MYAHPVIYIYVNCYIYVCHWVILHTINTVNSLYGRIRTSRGQSQWLITRDLWVNPFELVANGTQTPNYPAIRPRKRNRMALYYINRKNWHFLFTKMPFHHFPPLFKKQKKSNLCSCRTLASSHLQRRSLSVGRCPPSGEGCFIHDVKVVK